MNEQDDAIPITQRSRRRKNHVAAGLEYLLDHLIDGIVYRFPHVYVGGNDRRCARCANATSEAIVILNQQRGAYSLFATRATESRPEASCPPLAKSSRSRIALSSTPDIASLTMGQAIFPISRAGVAE